MLRLKEVENLISIVSRMGQLVHLPQDGQKCIKYVFEPDGDDPLSVDVKKSLLSMKFVSMWSTAPNTLYNMIQTRYIPCLPVQTCMMMCMMSRWPLVRGFISLLCTLYTVEFNITDCLTRKQGKKGGGTIVQNGHFPNKTYQMCPTTHLKSTYSHLMAIPRNV